MNKKLVAPEEALAKAVEKGGFESMVRRAGGGAAGPPPRATM